jgi:hypothetical protein
MLVLQEVLDLNPRVIMVTLHHDHVMVITLVENGNHHVTTHTPHEIMTVAMDHLQALTIGKGVGKITLTGRNVHTTKVTFLLTDMEKNILCCAYTMENSFFLLYKSHCDSYCFFVLFKTI